jgi:hypothetical protein
MKAIMDALAALGVHPMDQGNTSEIIWLGRILAPFETGAVL